MKLSEMLERLADNTKDYIARSLRPLEQRQEALEAAIKSIPAGKDGAPGRDGKDGAPGARGEKGESGAIGERGLKGDVGEKGEPGIHGKDGPPGRDGIDGKDGAPGKDGRDGIDGKDGAPGEKGAPGINGKDGSPGVDGKPGERGEKGLDGVNGKDGAGGSDGKDGRDGRDGKDGATGVRGEKGDPGRDALAIDILPTIDETKSYPRGTFAEYRGGMIRAIRNTDPIAAGAGLTLASLGWSIAARGVWEETEELLADGRTTVRKTKYTCGTVFERKTKSAQIIYRDIFRPETEYDKGDIVTFGGSTWHCMVDKPTDKPGISDQWRLIVKKGAPGKDAVSK
jgi:hypothetical protein